MKKKLLSTVLSITMIAGLFAGCGQKEAETTPAADGEAVVQEQEETPAEAVEASEEGKVLNIYCWNDEFKRRIQDHYPGYTSDANDATKGTIGDVTVVWNITPNQDNAYQNNLDETLLKQADADADSKIDIFLVEADYALKYVDTEYTMPVADLGVTGGATTGIVYSVSTYFNA